MIKLKEVTRQIWRTEDGIELACELCTNKIELGLENLPPIGWIILLPIEKTIKIREGDRSVYSIMENCKVICPDCYKGSVFNKGEKIWT